MDIYQGLQVYVGNVIEFCKKESIPLGKGSNVGLIQENNRVDCKQKNFLFAEPKHTHQRKFRIAYVFEI